MTDDLNAFVDKRIKPRDHSSTSEFRQDQASRDEALPPEERFKALIEEGLSSPWDPTAWKDQRSALREKITTFKQQFATLPNGSLLR